MRLKCPHCGKLAASRTSRSFGSPAITTESYWQCTNIECGCCFKALTEVVGITSPATRPNPAVKLPLLTLRAKATAA